MSRPVEQGVSEAEIDDALRRARRIDPTTSREAVARYLQEIAEMTRQLEGIDPGETPGSAYFSPGWPTGKAQ